jgi:hypothetical protein
MAYYAVELVVDGCFRDVARSVFEGDGGSVDSVQFLF